MDVARWTEPDFLDPARQWIDEQLAAHGLAVTGEVEQPHVMKWSTVLRVPTADLRPAGNVRHPRDPAAR